MPVQPHGGRLVDRIVPESRRGEYAERARELPFLALSEEKLKEVHNIAHGVFSPLEGFMTSEMLAGVLADDHLPSGEVWTIPILLDVPDEFAQRVEPGMEIALGGAGGDPVAIMRVEDCFDFDKERAAAWVFGTTDPAHPGVARLMGTPRYHLGGPIEMFKEPEMAYAEYFLPPRRTREIFAENGWRTVAAFQTRNPPHRAHEYLQKCALEICDGLFINPVIGQKKSGDFTDDVILAAYEELISKFYPPKRVLLSTLPWEMRYAGPKEAIFHAIVRKNFGCTHHIIGRDHAGVGSCYGTYAAQEIFDRFPDLGIEAMKFEHAFFSKICGNMGTSKTCPDGPETRINPSGTKIRAIVTEGAEVAPEIMRPEIARILASAENPFVP